MKAIRRTASHFLFLSIFVTGACTQTTEYNDGGTHEIQAVEEMDADGGPSLHCREEGCLLFSSDGAAFVEVAPRCDLVQQFATFLGADPVPTWPEGSGSAHGACGIVDPVSDDFECFENEAGASECVSKLAGNLYNAHGFYHDCAADDFLPADSDPSAWNPSASLCAGDTPAPAYARCSSAGCFGRGEFGDAPAWHIMLPASCAAEFLEGPELSLAEAYPCTNE